MLVAAMVGLDARSTIDMDATIKGRQINAEAIGKMFESILSVELEDYVSMKIKSIEEIREETEYSGIRVSIETVFDKIRQMLKVDVTTGENIAPREVNYSFRLMLEDRDIPVRPVQRVMLRLSLCKEMRLQMHEYSVMCYISLHNNQ